MLLICYLQHRELYIPFGKSLMLFTNMGSYYIASQRQVICLNISQERKKNVSNTECPIFITEIMMHPVIVFHAFLMSVKIKKIA